MATQPAASPANNPNPMSAPFESGADAGVGCAVGEFVGEADEIFVVDVGNFVDCADVVEGERVPLFLVVGGGITEVTVGITTDASLEMGITTIRTVPPAPARLTLAAELGSDAGTSTDWSQ